MLSVKMEQNPCLRGILGVKVTTVLVKGKGTPEISLSLSPWNEKTALSNQEGRVMKKRRCKE